MKVLIIALEGQIRDALEAQFAMRKRAFDSVGLEWLQSLSALDQKGLSRAIPANIGVVVNALSLESLQQQADDGVLDSLALLAQACDQTATPLISISTCDVFDGAEAGRHSEVDDVVPVSRLAALVARMEELIRGSCSRYIILRTGPVFSSQGDNLLTELLRSFEISETLALSTTGKSCPMHAKDLARVISGLIDQLSCGCESWGTYHYSSSDSVSHYQFAETVLATMSQYVDTSGKSLHLDSVDTLDEEWCRPQLNCEKILNTFGIKQLPWRSFIVPAVKKVFVKEPVVRSDSDKDL